MTRADADDPRLEDNLARVLLLVLTNAFVGGMVGLERTVLPLLAEAEYGVASAAAAVSFVATFGVTKAAVNFLAGGLADRWGRRSLLVGGWVVGLPVPLILMYAPAWEWVLAANVLLGVQQALTWSMTVVMKVDLVEPRHYGLVIGWNEFAGYAGLAATAALTGVIASTSGLRPEPFYVGLALVGCGLVLSLLTKDTGPRGGPRDTGPRGEGMARRDSGPQDDPAVPTLTAVLKRGTFADPTLSAASLAGLATNLKDGALWGLLPILLVGRDLPLERIGVVVAVYPAVWAVSQLVFGPMSDRLGRRDLIAIGVVLQAVGVAGFVFGGGYLAYLRAALVAGLGTGMVYPTLLALVSEASGPAWRASALGVYRLWRDLGYAVGALGAGLVADALGVESALWAVAGFTLVAAVAFRVRV